MQIHLLLALDDKQAIGCAVSMRSIIEHAAQVVVPHFHVMTYKVPGRDIEALRATVLGSGREAKISFYEIDISRFRHLMRSKIVSHTTYARLLIDELLPEEVTRCIYLDCDMVVVPDILDAWEYPLEGCTVAAVANGSPDDTRANQERLGLQQARYFNAGFVVIDVPRWRQRDVARRAMAHAERIGDRLVLHDQDALNCALEGDWTELPEVWNVWVRAAAWIKEDSRAVFHFAGAPKPWEVDYDGKFPALFHRYVDLTAYKGRRPWNPLGIVGLMVRARRKVPYLPAVLRVVAGAFRSRFRGRDPKRPTPA